MSCLCGDPECPSCGTAQGTYLEPRARLDDVIAMLQAYNAGIVSWDAEHVKELQAERLALLAKAARELPALAP